MFPDPFKPASFATDSKYIVAERSYSLLGVTFRVRSTSKEQEVLVHPIFSHLQAGDEASDVVFDIVQREAALIIFRNGNECASCLLFCN